MKRSNTMFIYFITFCLVLGMAAAASAQYDLSLESTSDGTTAKSVFMRGESLYVNIVLGNAADVAGCAFTLNYPASVLTPPATDAEGVVVTPGEITSIFPFSYGTTDTHRANSGEAGKIYFSGAAINPDTGGSKHTGGEVVLFTVKFTVKNDAVWGNFNLTLTQTELCNYAAGLIADNNSNQQCDAGEEVQVPVLVGALAQGVTGFDNFDCGNPPCAFPVLLGDTANPFSTVSLSSGIVPNETDYENWKTTNGWQDIGSSSSDYDQDGYSNMQELLNNTDPTTQDPQNGTGYDPSSDDRVPYFTGVHAGSQSLLFYGDSVTIDGVAAQPGDEIGVFTSDGIICGAYKLDQAGVYSITVYADDSATQEKDGADPNEVLVFKLYDRSEKSLITLSAGMLVPATVYGHDPSPYNPPQWTGDNNQWGLNIAATSSVVIPLKAGWNLFSFPVKKVFHVTDDQPTVATLSGSEFEKVSSIEDVLSSIAGKYKVVRGYDSTGAHTFDPAVPAFLNDLNYLAGGYGYWIYMNEEADLVINGTRAQASDTMSLNSGWNLIGCWASAVQHVAEADFTGISFETALPWIQITVIDSIFTPISGFFKVIRGYDAQGAHTFDPQVPSFLNNLYYVAPGYGYWVYMMESKPFHY